MRRSPTGIHRRLLMRYGKFDTVLPQRQVPVVLNEMSYRWITARGRCCSPPESKDPRGSFFLRPRKSHLVQQAYTLMPTVCMGALMTRKNVGAVWPDEAAHAPEFGERYINNTADASHDRPADNAILEARP